MLASASFRGVLPADIENIPLKDLLAMSAQDNPEDIPCVRTAEFG
jgi:hypothetical protein